MGKAAVSDNQSSSVTLNELAKKARKNITSKATWSRRTWTRTEHMVHDDYVHVLEESLQVMDDSLWDLDGVGDIKVAQNDNKMESEAFLIMKKDAEAHMTKALAGVDAVVHGLYRLDDPRMRRHRLFRNSNGGFLPKRGYGFAIFTMEAILWVHETVRKAYYTDRTGSLFKRHGQIIGLSDERVKNIFKHRQSMASFYLEEVLYKEALAGIFQSFTGQSYEVADTECGCTEQLSLLMAAKKGAELCTQKKTTFSEK